jgi:photosystem II stability/assembly factor-like uncharacterized protein
MKAHISISPLRCAAIPILALVMTGAELSAQRSWELQPKATTRNLRKMHFLNTMTGWVAGDSGTILKTTNGGLSWMQQSTEIVEPIVDIFMLDEQKGWALAHRYVYDTVFTFYTLELRTTDGGNDWQLQIIPDDLLSCTYFTSPLVGYRGSLFGRIFKTTDGGAEWREAVIEPGMFGNFPVFRIRFLTPVYGYAVGGRMDIAGVAWRTTDAGEKWEPAGIGPEPVHDLYYIDSLQVITVSGDLDFGSGMVRTSDGGENWEYRYLEIWGEARALAVRSLAEMWAPLGFPGTYMYTLDSTCTWCSVYTPDSSAVFDAAFLNDNVGYMVGNNGSFLKFVGLPGPTISVSSIFLAVTSGNLWRDNFIVKNCGSVPLTVDSIIVFSSDSISYSLSIQPSSFVLPAFGDTQRVQVEVVGTRSHSAVDFEDSLYIYSNDPIDSLVVILLRGDHIVDVHHGGGIPGSVTLLQNHPNPFNPQTEIRFDVAETRWVALRVFDILGRELETLAEGLKPPGSYSVRWNAAKYPSGVYFYRLNAGGYSETKKMILLR